MSANREHLLIVDDDKEIRNLLTDYLEQADYRVTAVGDGKAMRRVLESNRIDLVIHFAALAFPAEEHPADSRSNAATHIEPITFVVDRTPLL